MKIAFLDIDGVLNSYRTVVNAEYPFVPIERCIVRMLNKMSEYVPGLKFVVIDPHTELTKQHFLDVLNLYDFAGELHEHWRTSGASTSKCDNILGWLHRHNYNKSEDTYVILDDSLEYHDDDHHIWVSATSGITMTDACLAIAILNKLEFSDNSVIGVPTTYVMYNSYMRDRADYNAKNMLTLWPELSKYDTDS